MSEQEPQRRGPHRWQPGQSGNPRGRPRKANELADALRRKIPVEEIAARAQKMLDSENESTAMQALHFVSTYAGHKPAEKHELYQGALDDEEDLSGLTLEQLKRLDELEAERAEVLATPRTASQIPSMTAGAE